MQEIKNARKKLDDKLSTTAKKSEPTSVTSEPAKPANKFVRVAIQEEDEEEESTPAPAKTSTTSFEVSKESASLNVQHEEEKKTEV